MNLKYYEQNPIIKPSDISPLMEEYEVIGTFNPAIEIYNGKYYMLVRVAEKYKDSKDKVTVPIIKNGAISKIIFEKNDSNYCFDDSRVVVGKDRRYLTSMSRIVILVSEDGYHFKDTNISILPDNEYETFGIEDPRITKIDDIYYITYSSISEKGICASLAKTKDFKNIIKCGIIFYPENKDLVLFPRKINDEYVVIHRPSCSEFSKPEMWLSYSKDLEYFGKNKQLLSVGSDWDSARIGACSTPIELEDGWLILYHGATKSNVYSIGAILVDKNDLSKVLKRTKKPFLTPLNKYEKEGFVNNVVFVCGHIQDGDILHVYYGAADNYVALVDVSISDILSCLDE